MRSNSERYFWGVKALGGLVLGACVAATLLAWQFTRNYTDEINALRIDNEASDVQAALEIRLAGYINILRGGAGLFNLSGNVSREQWHRYVSSLQIETNAPGMQGVGYAQMLKADEKEAHTEAIRAQGFPAYKIKPDGVRDPLSAIIYLEPFTGRNLRAFGYDMFSEAIRRAAMESARDSGEPAITAHVTLMQETHIDVMAGFLIYVPVFKPGMPLKTVEQRRSALRGFVFSPFRIPDLMRGVLPKSTEHFDLLLYDNELRTPESLLFSSHIKTDRSAPSPRYKQFTTVRVLDRNWWVEVHSQPEFERQAINQLPIAVALCGTLLTGLLFIVLSLLLKRHETDQKDLGRLEGVMESAISTIDEGFVMYDKNDRLIYCNERNREIYAKSADLFIPGNTFEQIIRSGVERGQYPEANGRIEEWVTERLAAHRQANSTVLQRLENGRWLRIVERKTPDGAIVGFRVDITPLKIAQENAEASNLAKSRFLANMSHEIRTPINAVLGFTFLCLKQDLPPRVSDYLQNIQTASESLLFLVNDILDFSKIDAGKLELERLPFALGDVLQRVAKLFQINAKQKGIDLVISPLPDLPQNLLGDAQRLGQVLINLMSNALKFTEHGKISITVEALARNAEAVTLRFAVRDSGLGITPKQQANLFNAFTQADSSTTRKYGGTGLGLTLSQQLVVCMGGEIQVSSEAGVGSCFSFTVRFANAPDNHLPAPHKPHTIPALSGKHILVVEDNDFNRQVARELIGLTGATVLSAENGAQGVAAVARGGIDLVLMDIQMPILDGYDATRAIRRNWPELPIIALTAHALTDEKPRILAVGMNDILTKPILPEHLYAALAIWLPDTGQPATPDLPPPLPSAAPAPLELTPPPVAPAAPLVFDLALALTRVNGDRKMLDRFLNMFRERNASIVDKIKAGLALPDLTEARQQAHSLKGGAGTIGFIELQAAATRLEATLAQALQGADNPQQRSTDFAELKIAWTRAQKTLADLLDTRSNQ